MFPLSIASISIWLNTTTFWFLTWTSTVCIVFVGTAWILWRTLAPWDTISRFVSDISWETLTSGFTCATSEMAFVGLGTSSFTECTATCGPSLVPATPFYWTWCWCNTDSFAIADISSFTFTSALAFRCWNCWAGDVEIVVVTSDILTSIVTCVNFFVDGAEWIGTCGFGDTVAKEITDKSIITFTSWSARIITIPVRSTWPSAGWFTTVTTTWFESLVQATAVTVTSRDTCATVMTNITRHTFTSLFALCWACVMRFLCWPYGTSRTFNFAARASTNVPELVWATLGRVGALRFDNASTSIGITEISRITFTSDVNLWWAVSLNWTCGTSITTFSLSTSITSKGIMFTKWTLSRYSPSRNQ